MENSFAVNIPPCGPQCLHVHTFGHSVTMPGHKYGPAVRPYYLLHYILEGKGEYITEDTCYRLCAGKGFLIEPDYQTVYTADANEPWTYIWIGFSGADAPGILRTLGLSQRQPIFESDHTEELKNCIFGMIQHDHGNAADKFYILSMLYLFLSTVAASAQEDASRTDNNVYVSQAIAYIRDHIAEPLQAEAVARYVGLNRTYLSSLFKQYTGLSPLKYIQKLRLTKALHLLESSSLSVSAVAYSCGYQQTESLIRIFRQQYGISPAAYRKKILGQDKGGLLR